MTKNPYKIKKGALILILIISSVTWAYCAYSLIPEKSITPFDSEESFGLKDPILVLTNGTRYHVQEITPIYFEERGEIFFITMQIRLEYYNGSLTIKPSNPESDYTIYPNNEDVENATYSIIGVPFGPHGNKVEYPYDTYIGNITFWAENDNYGAIFLYFEETNYSSTQWNLNIFGYGNALHFRFYRVNEISTFETLKIIGLILFYIILSSYISFMLYWAFIDKTNKFKNSKWSIPKITILLGDTLFFSATLIGIPFYFGVIVNNYILPNYFQNSECILGLRYLMILLIIFTSCVYLLKRLREILIGLKR